ncbi:MAG: hypothetical protein WDZ41_05415 [Candidatus Babeliales bacterium]
MNKSIKSILLGILFVSFAGANMQAGITDWFKKPVKSVTNATQSAWNAEVSKTARRFASINARGLGHVLTFIGWINLAGYFCNNHWFEQFCELNDTTVIRALGKPFAFALAAYCLSTAIRVDKKPEKL